MLYFVSYVWFDGFVMNKILILVFFIVLCVKVMWWLYLVCENGVFLIGIEVFFFVMFGYK